MVDTTATIRALPVRARLTAARLTGEDVRALSRLEIFTPLLDCCTNGGARSEGRSGGSRRAQAARVSAWHDSLPGTTHYLVIVAVFKGVTLAAAAVSVGLLLTRGDWQALSMYQALTFWVAAFVAMVLTYDAILNGTMVSPRMLIGPADMVGPFVSTILEFSLFSLLGAVPWNKPRADQLAYLNWWLLEIAGFGLVSSGLILNALLHHTGGRKLVATPYGDLMTYYRGALRNDLVGSGTCTALVGSVFFLATRLDPAWRSVPQLFFGLYVVAILLYGLRSQEVTRREITRHVLPRAEPLPLHELIRR